MSSPGIRIRNGSSVVQIDNRYANLGLRYSTTITAGTSPTANNYYIATLTVAYNSAQVMAFQCAVNCCLVGQALSGGNITYTFYVKQSGGTVNIRIFDDTNLLNYTAGVPGIVIRNATTAAKIFDSRAKYMKVIDFVSATSGPTSTLTYNHTGANLYCVQLQPYWARTVSGAGGSVRIVLFYGPVMSISNGVATLMSDSLETYTLTNSADVATQFARSGYGYMLLDCLGF
jgi:hypothetical protein